MCEAEADVKKDCDQLKLAPLRRAQQGRCNPPAQIEGKSLKEKPRGQKPAHIVRQRNTKIGTTFVPYPDFGYCRFGPVHHYIPLRHHKSRDDRQGDSVQWSIESSIGAIEQS